MTEQEWLARTDPTAMLEFLRGKASDRKIRLFACACCNYFEHRLNAWSRKAVAVAEEFADNPTCAEELSSLWTPMMLNVESSSHRTLANAAWTLTQSSPWAAAELVTKYCVEVGNAIARTYLADVFGNSFHSVTGNPAWLVWNDGTVRRIAQAIYDERAFDRMPILADALEDAGCTDRVLLDHCRQPGEHVRGCWLIDMLTSRE